MAEVTTSAADVRAGRVPPQDLEAEGSVLGAILLDQSALDRIAGELRPDEFYRENNGQVYRAALRVKAEGEPIDNITLAAALEKAGVLERVGGRAHLALLQESVPTAANVETYARIVKAKALKRTLIAAGQATVADGYDESISAEEAMEAAGARILNVAIDGPHRARPTSDSVPELVKLIERRMAGGGGRTGLPTGLRELDRLTGGWEPGDLVLVAGRASMGKTAFMLNSALQVALVEQRPVVIFSLEMSEDQINERLLANKARVNSQRLHRGNLSDQEYERMVKAVGPLTAAKIEIDDRPALDEWAIAAEARRLAQKHGGLGLVAIDYLQRMRSRQGGENRVLELGTISSALKSLARELRCPVMALSQLSRAAETREDRRPLLSDLRDSGALEQDADVVVLLYRDDYYKREKSQKPGVAEVIVAKNRNGSDGTVEAFFRKEFSAFVDLDARHADPNGAGGLADEEDVR